MTYLPMDCPICTRRRLLVEIVAWNDGTPFVRSIRCEKCEHTWPEETEHIDGSVSGDTDQR